ncbi:hypothetical protein [Kitasatospora sp. DSM 101779]|uniref:hypothetical protein n=1 Tax=Kitasatospora sp. DSM 101779 TaxID=2853165 RepID=UPI0021DAC8C3|nr:hypothetical protein [Kitasatospora sp. DSM 101779]MCU7823857.1 hypothetical protein [Kitasatospora sp. DSM 101779]
MPEFTIRTLALTDDKADTARASDGRSRFGVYLANNAHLLNDFDDPLSPASFALTVWRIATAPVMAPGYVHLRPDLHNITLVAPGEDTDGLALRIEVPLRHRTLATWPARIVADWQPDPWATGHSGFTALARPDRADRTALLLTATVLLPVPANLLVAPTGTLPGPEMTRQAKQIVAALVGHTNAHAHLVNDLTAGVVR